MIAAPALSNECRGWLLAADYSIVEDDRGGAFVIAPSSGKAGGRYSLRRRHRGHLSLVEMTDEDEEEFSLHASAIDLIERFLIGVVADKIYDRATPPPHGVHFTGFNILRLAGYVEDVVIHRRKIW